MSSGAGNVALCAIQMRMSMDDFASEQAFTGHVDRLAARAVALADRLADSPAGARHRLLVFPENLGTFLPLIWASPRARRQPTVDDAIAVAATGRLARIVPAMLGQLRRSPPGPALRQAVLLALMPAADRFMRQVFSSLARRHRAHVVAGSHLVPVASSGGGGPGHGLSNGSLLFGPDGALLATTHKVNLVPGMEDDLPGGLALVRGHPGGLRAVATPWGKVATLICYDGFCRPHSRFERFAFMGAEAEARSAQVIANPSANPWPWRERWLYADAGSEMLRSEQWRREGLAGTLERLRSVQYGITAHLCGELLDLAFCGQSEVLQAPADPGSGEARCLARSEDPHGEDVIAAVVDVAGER